MRDRLAPLPIVDDTYPIPAFIRGYVVLAAMNMSRDSSFGYFLTGLSSGYTQRRNYRGWALQPDTPTCVHCCKEL